MSSLKKHWGFPSSDLRPLHRVLAVGYLALLRAWKLQGKKTSSQKIELFLHQAFRGNLTTNDCPFFVFLFQGTVDPSSVMYNEISPQTDGYFYIFLWVTHVWITLTCHAAELLWRFYARTPLQRGNALTIPVLCLALQVAMGQSLALAWYAWGKRSSNEQLLQRPKYLAACHFFQPEFRGWLTLLVHYFCCNPSTDRSSTWSTFWSAWSMPRIKWLVINFPANNWRVAVIMWSPKWMKTQFVMVKHGIATTLKLISLQRKSWNKSCCMRSAAACTLW